MKFLTSVYICVVVFSTQIFAAPHNKGDTPPSDVSVACVDLKPHHAKEPQTIPFPYQLTTDKTEIKPLDKVEVKISGNGIKFKGFMVQARQGDEIIGQFETTALIDNKSDTVKLITCKGGNGNTVTNKVHPDKTDKSEVILTWIAPAKLEGKFEFLVTVVKDFDTYWVAQKSEQLTATSS